MILPGSYANGFAPRDGMPLYPELWRGCVGAWAPCLGPTGLTLRDWSGYQNHGTLTNMDAGSDWVASNKGTTLDFDGVNDFVDCGTRLTTAVANALSVSMWVRCRSRASLQYVFANVNASGADCNVGLIFGLTANKLGWTQSAASQDAVSAGSITDGDWHHVCATRSGTTGAWRIGLYIDGSGAVTTTTVNQIASGSVTGTLVIGRAGSFNGLYGNIIVGDVRLYNREITHRETLLLASHPSAAYMIAPRKRARALAAFRAYWAARKAQIIGGGL